MRVGSLKTFSSPSPSRSKVFTTKRRLSMFPSLHSLPPPKTEEQKFVPEIDEVPRFITVMQSRIELTTLTEQVVLRDLPKSMEDENFNQIFDNLISICQTFPQFVQGKENHLWNMKSKALQDLNHFFNRFDASLLPNERQISTFNMLYQNIFAVVPKYPSLLESNFYQADVIDPISPHLNVCFHILFSFIKVYPQSKCLSTDILKKAILLLNQGDENVRNNMYTFIEMFLENRIDLYHFILKTVSKQLNNAMDNAVSLYCVPHLLKLLFLLFNKSNKQPPTDYYKVIRNDVLSLLRSPYYYFFSVSFNHLIKAILERKQNRNSNSLVCKTQQSLVLQPKVRSDLNTGRSTSLPVSYDPNQVTVKKTTTVVLKPYEVLTKIRKYWPKTNTLNIAAFVETTSWVLDASVGQINSYHVVKTCKFMKHFLYIPSNKILSAFTSIMSTNWAKAYSKELSKVFGRDLAKIAATSNYNDQIMTVNKIINSLNALNPSSCPSSYSSYDRRNEDDQVEYFWMAIEETAEVISDYECDIDQFFKSVKKMTESGRKELYS